MIVLATPGLGDSASMNFNFKDSKNIDIFRNCVHNINNIPATPLNNAQIGGFL